MKKGEDICMSETDKIYITRVQKSSCKKDKNSSRKMGKESEQTIDRKESKNLINM